VYLVFSYICGLLSSPTAAGPRHGRPAAPEAGTAVGGQPGERVRAGGRFRRTVGSVFTG
jgi:hypothetical protein